jgi:hypothetical protein
VVDENTFNYSGTAFTSYYGQQIFVFDKAAAYANTLSSVSLFDAPFTGCVSPFETQLGCGFTMAPAITEDNTTDTEYLVEDWDSTAAQLRLSKLTGTPAAPVITVGTQFPQSTNSWRFDARRISTSGGYMPQRENAIYAANSQRIMANDSRIQNAVLRGGSLWTTHTVMLSGTPQLAGVCIGGTSVCGVGTNIDNHSGIQWWQINPTIETGLAQAPIQRGRIEDATADNCHDGNGGTRATGLCVSTATQVGTFFAFPNISVNMNNDVMIGFSQFSPLTWPTSTYAFRANATPPTQRVIRWSSALDRTVTISAPEPQTRPRVKIVGAITARRKRIHWTIQTSGSFRSTAAPTAVTFWERSLVRGKRGGPWSNLHHRNQQPAEV